MIKNGSCLPLWANIKSPIFNIDRNQNSTGHFYFMNELLFFHIFSYSSSFPLRQTTSRLTYLVVKRGTLPAYWWIIVIKNQNPARYWLTDHITIHTFTISPRFGISKCYYLLSKTLWNMKNVQKCSNQKFYRSNNKDFAHQNKVLPR